jgi:hypothetical protein
MAKIFYVTETTPDYAQVNFFKTEKEALDYGISELPQFDMFDEPTNDEEADGEEWYQGDSLTFKKGILFSWEGGEVYVQAMEEDAAREYVEELGEEGGAIFFDGFSRGMYGYLGRAADGKGFKWDWDGYDLNESTSTSSLKHVQLFEQFVNEDIKIRTNISEETAQELLQFLKRAIGKKLNWKEFKKWHGGPAQLGKKEPQDEKFLTQNFKCEIVDVFMNYDPSRKGAKYAIQYKSNMPWFKWNSRDDRPLMLYKDDPNWDPSNGDPGSTKEWGIQTGLRRNHYEKQFNRLSDITGIGRFGI